MTPRDVYLACSKSDRTDGFAVRVCAFFDVQPSGMSGWKRRELSESNFGVYRVEN